jgi:hypothetical protein
MNNKRASILAIIIVLMISNITIITVSSKKIENNLEKQSENPVEYYALIIAVEEFNETFSQEYEEDAIDDGAIAFYNQLIQYNWSEDNVKLLLNENATKQDIKNAITEWLDEKEDENDVVLYYFSGHSWKVPILKRRYGNTYSFPYDIYDNLFSDDKITDKELDSWLDELESKHMALIMDTCYSGRMKALVQTGRILLAAGGKRILCPVSGDVKLGTGIFSFFLMQGFDGVADINNDGWVTAEEAFRYARLPTFHFSVWKWFPYTKHLPFFIGIQIPYMYDRYLGQLPLIKYA